MKKCLKCNHRIPDNKGKCMYCGEGAFLEETDVQEALRNLIGTLTEIKKRFDRDQIEYGEYRGMVIGLIKILFMPLMTKPK